MSKGMFLDWLDILDWVKSIRGGGYRLLDLVVSLVHVLVYSTAMEPSCESGEWEAGGVWARTLLMPLVSAIT